MTPSVKTDDGAAASFEAWTARLGLTQAYRCHYFPTHLGGRNARRVDVFEWRGRWLFARTEWSVFPSPSSTGEPALTRGAPLGRRAVLRVQEAFERVRFFDAPDATPFPGLDGGTWTIHAKRSGRAVTRSAHSASVGSWPFDEARTAILGVSPSLLRWPRTVELG